VYICRTPQYRNKHQQEVHSGTMAEQLTQEIRWCGSICIQHSHYNSARSQQLRDIYHVLTSTTSILDFVSHIFQRSVMLGPPQNFGVCWLKHFL